MLLAEVDLPRSADVDALQARLAEVSAELGVDTTMRLLENDQAVNLTLPTLPDGRVLDVVHAPSQVLSIVRLRCGSRRPGGRSTLRRPRCDHARFTGLRGSRRASGRG